MMTRTLKAKQVHLDYHNADSIPNIGGAFSQTTFQKTLEEVKVDSITCFAKCHHGNLYYQTALPEKHPTLQRPLLNLQASVTKKIGVQMPVYISVGFDEKQAMINPQWIAIDETGRQIKEFGHHPFDSGWHWLCLNTNYTDKIVEVIKDVTASLETVDGFFFDIVTQPPCCCKKCLTDMLVAKLNPELATDRALFARQVESTFKAIVCKAIKETTQNASIFFNGLEWNKRGVSDFRFYTHLEIESLASGNWGYEHYPLVSKYLQQMPYPTIAMTARFHLSWADFGGYKNPLALEYETVRGMIMSDGVSIGDQMNPDGSLDEKTYQLITEAFQTIEPIYDELKTANTYAEVAILNDNTNPQANLFADAISGAGMMLREAKIAYTIIEKMQSFGSYQCLVLADNLFVDEELHQRLWQYIDAGGKVLATYQSLPNLEKTNCFPVATAEVSTFNEDYIDVKGTKYIAYTAGMRVTGKENTSSEQMIFNPYFNRTYQHFSSHFQAPYDASSQHEDKITNGQISYLAHPYFSLYKEYGNDIYKELIINEIKKLYTPIITIEDAPTALEVEILQDKENKQVFYICPFYYPIEKKHKIHTVKNKVTISNLQFTVQSGLKIKSINSLVGAVIHWQLEEASFVVEKLTGYDIIKIEIIS